MSKNIVLIDADSLCYIGKSEDKLIEILQKVDDKINAILTECKADYYCLFISKGKYFRHDLTVKQSDSLYKGQRTYTGQPYKQVIKAYLEAEWGAVNSKSVEADDLIAYWMNNSLGYAEEDSEKSIELMSILKSAQDYLQEGDIKEDFNIKECNIIMAAVDKDLLKSIPGKHLNYNKKTGADTWEMVWIDSKEEDCNMFIWEQMLMGDTSDGVKGIPKVGPVKAKKFLQNKPPDLSYSEIVLRKYYQYYGVSQGIYEFQKNYRLLHMLNTDEDFMREVGYIPILPTFKKFDVNTEEQVTLKF